MKTKSFILQSPTKYNRDGLISVVANIDKSNNKIHIQYCDENYQIIDQVSYDYNEYMNEMFKDNGLKRNNNAI